MNMLAQAAIIVGVAAACIGLLWVARRSPLNERFASQLGEHGRAFDFLSIAFAVEAEAVLELSRTAEAFALEEHERLEGLAVCYGRAVIEQGWPAMRNAEEGSPVVTEWARRFRGAAFALDVRSQIEQVPPAPDGAGPANRGPAHQARRGHP